MKQVNIYTCTSFEGMKKQEGAIAYILEVNINAPVTLQETLIIQNATPNCAELKVIIEALKRMNQKCELTIYTESNYVAAGFNNGWLSSWKANGWKTARGKEISNKDEWSELDKLLEGHIVTIKTNENHSYRKWLKTEVSRKEKEI